MIPFHPYFHQQAEIKSFKRSGQSDVVLNLGMSGGPPPPTRLRWEGEVFQHAVEAMRIIFYARLNGDGVFDAMEARLPGAFNRLFDAFVVREKWTVTACLDEAHDPICYYEVQLRMPVAVFDTEDVCDAVWERYITGDTVDMVAHHGQIDIDHIQNLDVIAQRTALMVVTELNNKPTPAVFAACVQHDVEVEEWMQEDKKACLKALLDKLTENARKAERAGKPLEKSEIVANAINLAYSAELAELSKHAGDTELDKCRCRDPLKSRRCTR